MGFADDLKKFRLEVERKATARVRKVSLAALSSIVARTPVLTGCARGNWRISFGSALNRTIDDKSFDPSGRSVIGLGSANIGDAKLGVDVNICNSVPYIFSLENGYSKQSPAGMVGITVRTLKPLIERGLL